MNSLEDNIIKKVYTSETVDVCAGVILKLTLLTVAGFSTVLFTVFALTVIFENKIFDLFSKSHVVYAVFTALPKLELFFALVSLIAFIVLVFTTMASFKKITYRFKSVVRYWFVHSK